MSVRVHAIIDADLTTAGTSAASAERIGFDGVWTTETAHDPFLPLVPAVLSTSRLMLGTAIAVAFPRSPTHLAMLGDDLHRHSSGRFMLGLGAQVRAHVEQRFGAAFEHPADRMRELVLAVRAIWDCWQHDRPLDVRGRFYNLGLMTPAFSPGPNPFGHPAIYVAAVGERMAEVAGEVADGVLVHGFSTAGYLRDVTLPALRRGEDAAARPRGVVSVSRPVFIVTGRDDAEIEAAAAPVRERLGFYGSTPSYRPVLEHEGWESLGAELRRLVRAGRWGDLGGPIDPQVLDALAIVGPVEEIADRIIARFGNLADRVSFNVPFLRDPTTWEDVVARLQTDAGGSARDGAGSA